MGTIQIKLETRNEYRDQFLTHLEPGVGRGGEEETGEAPDGVGEGSTPGEVGQRHQHPLGQHPLLVLPIYRGNMTTGGGNMGRETSTHSLNSTSPAGPANTVYVHR